MKNTFNIALTTIALCTSLLAAKYPVVGGKEMYPTKDIVENALKTVQGEPLTATMSGDLIALQDQSGNTANVTIADVNQSNGVIHVVDTVLLPK
jgi:uncharacterized surface protein with fasciclin (FAS1) repeats